MGKLTYLKSSAIRGVQYDRKNKVLKVYFNHGGDYTYSNIGYHRYRKLVTAESVGKYFNEAIKPRRTA